VIRSLARLGGGLAEFMQPNTLPNQKKLQRQFDRALQPALTDISVKWNTNHPETLCQAPNEITSLFNGDRKIIYGSADYCTQATLEAKSGDRELSTLVSTHELAFKKGRMLHILAARAMIRDWADGNYDTNRLKHDVIKRERKDEIIKLSKQYSIVTEFTSFGKASQMPLTFC